MDKQSITTHQIQRLYVAQQVQLMDFILGLVRDPHQADDLYQEVSLVILGKQSMPIPAEAFPGWCRQVAKHKALHLWRSQRRSRLVRDSALAELADQAFEEAENDHQDQRGT